MARKRRSGPRLQARGIANGGRPLGRVVGTYGGGGGDHLLFGSSFPDEEVIPTEADALAVPTWMGCMIILGGTLSRLELKVVGADGEYLDTRSAEAWRRDVDMRSLTRQRYAFGNSFVVGVPGGDGMVASMYQPHPTKVSRDWDGTSYYYVVDGATIPAGRMLHFRSPIRDGGWGASPRNLMRRELATSVRASQYAGATFTRDPQGSLVIVDKTGSPGYETDGPDQDEGGEEDEGGVFSRFFQGLRGPRSRGKFLELYGDIDIHQLQPRAREAQLLEARRFQGMEIARALQIPPVLVGHQEGSSVYGPAIRSVQRNFITTRLAPEIRDMERELDAKLLHTGSGLRHWFDPSDITAFDARETAEIVERLSGQITVNEARERNGMARMMMPDGSEDPRGLEIWSRNTAVTTGNASTTENREGGDD